MFLLLLFFPFLLKTISPYIPPVFIKRGAPLPLQDILIICKRDESDLHFILLLAFGVPNYKLKRTSGDWDDNYDYTHLKVAKKHGIKVSDKAIFEKNETEKSVYR